MADIEIGHTAFRPAGLQVHNRIRFTSNQKGFPHHLSVVRDQGRDVVGIGYRLFGQTGIIIEVTEGKRNNELLLFQIERTPGNGQFILTFLADLLICTAIHQLHRTVLLFGWQHFHATICRIVKETVIHQGLPTEMHIHGEGYCGEQHQKCHKNGAWFEENCLHTRNKTTKMS